MTSRVQLHTHAASLFALAAMLATVACSHNVQVPPSRPISLEAPASIGAGKTHGRLQLSTHDMLFNGTFRSGNVRLRSGRSDRLELSADGTVVAVEGETEQANMYLGRIGAKINPGASKNVAFFGGVGGGLSPVAGSMVSADGGVTVGYHNRFLVPFLSLSTFMSRPIDAKEVRTGTEPDQVDTPTLSAGSSLSLGLAVIRDTFSVTAGVGSTLIRDEDGDEGVFTVGIALELELD